MRPDAFEEFLLEYLEGTLTEPRRRVFEEHLREHPEDRARLRQHEQLDQLLGELAEDTDAPLVNGAVARMTGAARSLPLRRRPVAAGWWLAAAAAAVVAAGLWWLRPGSGETATDPSHVAQPDPPAFLEDPEFQADLAVILALPDLEGAAALLDVEGDGWMADVVALEVLDGA